MWTAKVCEEASLNVRILNVHTLTYVHMYTCIHRYIHCVRRLVFWMYTHLRMYTCMHTYIHCVSSLVFWMHTHEYERYYSRECVRIDTYIHAYKHTRIQTYIHCVSSVDGKSQRRSIAECALDPDAFTNLNDS